MAKFACQILSLNLMERPNNKFWVLLSFHHHIHLYSWIIIFENSNSPTVSVVYIYWWHTYGRDKLEPFLVDFNKFHPSLKFTHESSRKNVTSWDSDAKFLKGQIITDLLIKSTNRHQYLHYTSSHPHHTKRSIVYSQALRVSRICSFKEDFEIHRNQMKLRFLNRRYPKWLIDAEVWKVKFPCTSRKRDTKMKGIHLVITYHLLLKDFASAIRKRLCVLYLNKEVKEIFTPDPMVSFRRERKIGRLSC